MARFYDHLKRDDEHIDPELRRMLNEAVVIDGTNLSDYLYLNEAKGDWDLVKDYFNLAPPFHKFFVECRAPKQLLTKKGKVPWPRHLPQEWGVLFTVTELKTLSEKERMRLLGGPFDKDEECLNEIMDVHDKARWVLQGVLFAPNPQGRPDPGKMREQYSWWFLVMPDGSQPTSSPRTRKMKFEYVVLDGMKSPEVVTEDGIEKASFTEDMMKLAHIRHVDSATRFWYPDDRAVSLNQRNDELWDELQKGTTDNFIKVMSLADDIPSMNPAWQAHYTMVEELHWLPLLQPCLMSICWMHVKNVKLEAKEPSETIKKKAIKRYGEPPCKYHVLEIQPFKQVLEHERTHGPETGIRQALHICRGHFQHYGDEFGKGKLFGKLSGSYWIPAHLRGTTTEGLMDKTYKLKPPVEAEKTTV